MKSIFDEIRNNRNFSTQKSTEWYRKQIKELAVRARDPRLLSDPTRKRNSVEVGYLYMYGYDPKTKDALPFFDRFPLAFIFDFAPGGWYGINFHYLPYTVRFKLYDLMIGTANNKNLSDTDKLRINWSTLKNVSKFPMVRPAVKRYLIDHVQTNFIKIPITDWKTALMLPVEQFVGASNNAVWNQSRQIMRGI